MALGKLEPLGYEISVPRSVYASEGRQATVNVPGDHGLGCDQ